MKILELALSAFGPFTDVVLDLSGGQQGVHLVYGPNEAGKSSALRALKQALFGIPMQSADDFLHAYQKLRIGLRLRNGAGRELAFVRRKGIKNTLLAADGSTPLPDSALATVLKGMTEAEFTRRFAMDHDELVAGGQSILGGSGELGQLLFQTGGGLKNLLEVQRGLDRELEGLFKPAGSRPRINAGLAELKEAKAMVRAGSLPSTEWLEHEAARRTAAERLEQVEGRLEAARAEKRRLERLGDALPVLARLRQCQQDWAELGTVVILPEDFTDSRHEALSRRDAAVAAEAAAQQAVAELDRQIDGLAVPEDLLAEAEAVEQLRDALAGYRKALAALPDERSRLRLVETEIQEMLAELGTAPARGPDHPGQDLLDAAEAFRPSRAQKAAIAKRTAEHARLTAEHDQAGARVAELTARLEAERTELDRLETPGDPGPLALALRQARDQGDLDGQLETARARLDQAEREAARALGQLPLWTGPLEAIVALAVPSAETVDRFEVELAELDAELARLRADRGTVRDELTGAESSLEQLRLSAGVLPTEDDLAAARARRDRIWRLIRRITEAIDPPSPAEIRAVLGEESASPAASPVELITIFEAAVHEADARADRLWREAERVATQAGARAALDRARQRMAAVDDQARQAAAQAEAVRARWSAAWAPAGIEPLSPREMRGWLQARQGVVLRAIELQDRRAELEALTRKLAAQGAALDQALRRLGEPAAMTGETLSARRDRAEAVLARLAKAAARRSELIQSAGELQRQLDAARGQAQAAEERLCAWRDAWAKAIAPLGLSADATPEQADAVLEQAASLAGRIKDARQSRARIESLEREVNQFARDLRELLSRVTPDRESRPAGDPDTTAIASTAQELIRRLAAAQQAKARRDELRIRREQELANARSARRQREDAETRLAVLCREAGCAAPDELPAAERASRAARQLQNRIQELDQQLGRLCGHEAIESFRQAALALDVDRLPDRVSALAAEIDRLDAERAELNQELGRRRSELARMDGEGRAAEANERVEQLKSRLTHEVEEYARLRLAAVVLREAIERYRQKTQGPVLDRAGRLFASLTLGSFQGLRVEYDDHDQALLQAVRPGGAEAVGVHGLSLGTADQLYLALRLASIETALESHEPIPMIADDILIQFDNQRTAAALRVLAELSRRTQVILFTHHEYVCELAETHLDSQTLFVHRLPGRSTCSPLTISP